MSRQLVDVDFRAFIHQDVGIWDTRPGHPSNRPTSWSMR